MVEKPAQFRYTPVMPVKSYTFGDPISDAEYQSLLQRFIPKGGKRRKPAQVIYALNVMNPHRLAHEIDRMRGIAFDSGEAGFSHTVVGDTYEYASPADKQGNVAEPEGRVREQEGVVHEGVIDSSRALCVRDDGRG